MTEVFGGANSERIVVILDLVDNLTKKMNAVADNTQRITKEISNRAKKYDKLEKAIGKTNKAMKKTVLSALGAAPALRRFGDALVGLTRPAMDAFNVFDVWNNMLLLLFLPIISVLVPILYSIMFFFMELPEPLKLFITVFLIVVGVVALATAGFLAMTFVMSTFGIASIAALWPILLIIAAVALVITIIVLLWKNWDSIWGWIRTAATNVAKWIRNAWVDMKHFFIILFNDIGIVILKAVKGWVEFLTYPLMLLSKIPGMGFLADGVEVVTGVFDGLINTLEENKISENIRYDAEKAANVLSDNMNAMVDKTTDGLDTMNSSYSNGLDKTTQITNIASTNKNNVWGAGMATQLGDTTSYVDKINAEMRRINTKTKSSGSFDYNQIIPRGQSVYNPDTGGYVIGSPSGKQSSAFPMSGGVTINQTNNVTVADKKTYQDIIDDNNYKLISQVQRLTGA